MYRLLSIPRADASFTPAARASGPVTATPCNLSSNRHPESGATSPHVTIRSSAGPQTNPSFASISSEPSARDATHDVDSLPRSSERRTCDLKRRGASADTGSVDAAERKEILNRYRDHSRRFEAAAARRSSSRHGSVIPFTPPATREVGQDPTAREIEVLQLVSDGLVNREIGERLFLSEETVKSHVRHLLAKLQARSRAHAVAVGFRRGLIA